MSVLEFYAYVWVLSVSQKHETIKLQKPERRLINTRATLLKEE